jgi:hypothetical protein
MRGDTRAVTLARRADLCPRIDDPVRGGLTLFSGMGRYLQSDWDGAAADFAEGAELTRASGNVMLEVLARTSLGAMSESMGRLHEAEGIYQAALRTAVQNRSPVAGQAYACLARVYRQWNDLTSARSFAVKFIESGAAWGAVDSLACGNLFLAVLFQRQNETAAAERALAQANQIMQEHPHECPGSGSAPQSGPAITEDWMTPGHGRNQDSAWRIFDRKLVEYIALARILLASTAQKRPCVCCRASRTRWNRQGDRVTWSKSWCCEPVR